MEKTYEKLLPQLEQMAKEQGMSLWELVDVIYRKREQDYDIEDIINFLDQRELLGKYNSATPSILEKYRDDYDCSIGYEDNLERAMEELFGKDWWKV